MPYVAVQVGYDEDIPVWVDHPSKCDRCGASIVYHAHWHNQGKNRDKTWCIDCFNAVGIHDEPEEMESPVKKESENDG